MAIPARRLTCENYAAEVDNSCRSDLNCNSCHVDDSYKVDRGTLGAVVQAGRRPTR